eukprot:TRINITY_DN37109_c0_g1_i1.p1 TRINITY_DN37109_c0_g1~~TRINITY_DN37109_c0_g1_i1.p1  ORF type:complete len:190 (-),score=11.76 TRINITY_DN37109_c0_g1_i1:386-901(-)
MALFAMILLLQTYVCPQAWAARRGEGEEQNAATDELKVTNPAGTSLSSSWRTPSLTSAVRNWASNWPSLSGEKKAVKIPAQEEASQALGAVQQIEQVSLQTSERAGEKRSLIVAVRIPRGPKEAENECSYVEIDVGQYRPPSYDFITTALTELSARRKKHPKGAGSSRARF